MKRFLLFLNDPANKDFREEARIYYDMSRDAGERPYTYYFEPWELPCLHTRNAIDLTMRSLWVEHENQKNAERYPSTPQQNKPETPEEDGESPVVIVSE